MARTVSTCSTMVSAFRAAKPPIETWSSCKSEERGGGGGKGGGEGLRRRVLGDVGRDGAAHRSSIGELEDKQSRGEATRSRGVEPDCRLCGGPLPPRLRSSRRRQGG